MQIGVRLVLPLVALLAVGTAAAVVRAWQEGRRLAARQLLAAAAGIGLAWTAADAAAVWPHGLCYVNELWGGTATGYLRLSDSNYDWGQGLPELARWQGEHGIEPLDVWYFGTDPRLRTMPVREVPFHVLPDNATDPLAAVRGHYLAVSTTLLHGPEGPNELSRRVVAVLRACRPVGRTTTFWIYDFRESVEPESPGAGSQVSRSSVGLRAGPARHPR